MSQSSLNLCFFWHMHQPDYRGSDGVMSMPWVFLHAIKDYYEMPWLLSRHKGLKATFNITAPLIEQLNLYKEPLKNDYFLSLWHMHPSELDDNARTWLIKTCKSTQYETMVRPIAHFSMLYHQEILSDAELIDFEVVFMLAWCGNYLRQENTLVKELFAKEKGFTQEDKTNLLKILSSFVQTILPFYAQLQEEGVISLSTTPYNHPILPLLLDMNNAKRANEHTTLPDNPMSMRVDAIEQVERSIALYKETFGKKPTGFWPAEGAVDEESVAIYKERGISWIATDEAILFRSLEDENRKSLYKPYSYNGVTIGFRDHGLSDLIGFNYRFKSGDDASEHFMQVVEPIAKENDNATLFVILDGENAWEFFENNAYDFFNELYHRFSITPWCNTVTMDEVSKLKNQATLEKLSPGSWIHGNFDTWSGHSEKNRAWELIYQTRRDVNNYTKDISSEVAQKIQFHFLASECSDWFWWYGDDHVTEFALEFDTLFRNHLISIYSLLKIEAPRDLFEPIISHKSSESFLLKPQKSISPLIDGKYSSFFEWLGSGCVNESKLYSTMDRVRGPIEKIHYGHNEETLFLAFEGDMSSLEMSHLQLEIIFEETSEHLLFNMDRVYEDKEVKLAIDERIELAISRKHFKNQSSVHLRFEILNENNIIQTMPGYGALFIDLDESYAENWFV
ncbi:glycoside hydrolase [Sulfurimonas aquatica]|uniref:Glycoside hydrolase n=1 Tax=Sulfurimonas aquatica TaxID=2672570 RepID=A0A975B0F1_9BACT|nr:glycoside hydrolase family 57 protein [Sulfurimonas aquatica]QSZ41942.1 glycoside hydrolase [Sulfurimonas aquatica]